MDWNDVLYRGIAWRVLYRGIAWRVLYRGIAWRGSWRVYYAQFVPYETRLALVPDLAEADSRRAYAAAAPRIGSSISPGASCPSELAMGLMGPARRILVSWSARRDCAKDRSLLTPTKTPGASVLNVAVGGVHGPVVEMASTAASADRGAGSDTATDDDDGEDDGDNYFFPDDAISSAIEVRRADIRRRVGARQEIVAHLDHPDRSNPSGEIKDLRRRVHVHAEKAAHVRAAHVVGARATSAPKAPPTGYYYYTAGAATYIQNPAGAHSPGGASAGFSALNPNGAPAGSYYKRCRAPLTSKTLPAPIVRRAHPRRSPTQAGRTAPPAPAPRRRTQPAHTTARTRSARLFLEILIRQPQQPAFSRSTARQRWRITMAPQASKPASRTNSSPATAALRRQCSSRDIPVGAAGRICMGPTSQPHSQRSTKYKRIIVIDYFPSLTIPIQQYTYSVGSIDFSGVNSFRRRPKEFRLSSIPTCTSRPRRQEAQSSRTSICSPDRSAGTTFS